MGKRNRRRERQFVSLPHLPFQVHREIFLSARLAWFMHEEEQGRWRLRHFEVTEEAYGQRQFENHYTAKNPEDVKSREVPPGQWVSLQRRMTEHERVEYLRDQIGSLVDELPREAQDIALPPERQWAAVMSDTPSEIIEHAPALNEAHGRVLITGLGLGCLPHALVALDQLDPEVTGGRVIERIDIIEIDADVIALTGKYLADPRVFIWNGSADNLDAIPEVVRAEGWDYAWHDIWSQVSNRNLNDDEAEHGISYGKLFDLWAPHVRGEQHAWAFEMAHKMQEVYEEERKRERQFRNRLRSLPLDEAVPLFMRHLVLDRFQFNENTVPSWGNEDDVPEQAVRMLDPDGKIEAHVREQLADPEFWERFARDVEAHDDDPNPLDRPNEVVR